jgi:nitrogen fixation protein NifZ
MRPIYDYGEVVRVTRNIRNDGTYPGETKGTLLVRRGSVGYVRNVGTFLQNQIIYSVDFFAAGRLVGCREQELIPADAPWKESQFEIRDRVNTELALAVKGQVVVEAGDEGEVIEVLRDEPDEVHYHVRFDGATLQVPEFALTLAVNQEMITETHGAAPF